MWNRKSDPESPMRTIEELEFSLEKSSDRETSEEIMRELVKRYKSNYEEVAEKALSDIEDMWIKEQREREIKERKRTERVRMILKVVFILIVCGIIAFIFA